jgi:hypothetical protein
VASELSHQQQQLAQRAERQNAKIKEWTGGAAIPLSRADNDFANHQRSKILATGHSLMTDDR